mgnify:CR=1 FL=1
MILHRGGKSSRREQESYPNIENAAIIGTLRTPPSEIWNISDIPGSDVIKKEKTKGVCGLRTMRKIRTLRTPPSNVSFVSNTMRVFCQR